MAACQFSLEDELNSMTECYEWTIDDITIQLKERLSEIHSKVFQLPGYPFSARARILHHGFGHYEISLQLFDPAESKGPIELRPLPKVTYIFKDQSNHKDKMDIIRFAHCSFSESIEYENSIYTNNVLGSFLNKMDDCVKMKILIESPSISRHSFCNDGVILWKINNYRNVCEMMEDKLIDKIYSPPFYTSPKGYRVCVKFELRKSNSARRVHVDIYFLCGVNDTYLSIDFQHKYCMTIVNQEDNEKSVTRIKENEKITFNAVTIDSSELEELKGFLDNDSLLLKVKIHPSVPPIDYDD